MKRDLKLMDHSEMASIKANVSATNQEIKVLSPKLISIWQRFANIITTAADELPCAGDIYNEKN